MSLFTVRYLGAHPLLSTLVYPNHGGYSYFVCLFSQSVAKPLKEKCPFKLYCRDLLLHPGSIHRDDFHSLFTLPTPGRTFPPSYAELSRCQYLPERAFLWHKPISPKPRAMPSLQDTSPQRSHPVRTRSLWRTSVDFPHVAFPPLLERYLIDTAGPFLTCVCDQLELRPSASDRAGFLFLDLLFFFFSPLQAF